MRKHYPRLRNGKLEGTGMVINAERQILTIGYIVSEAKSVEITDVDGRVIPASVEGYDGNSGFGLLKALSPLRAQPLILADSSNIQAQEQLSVVSGLNDVVQQQVFVLERATFAGYWEYLLENAIFTVPVVIASTRAEILNEKGELVGIGSLYVQRSFQSSKVPCNMFVPTEVLLPILEDLKRYGKPSNSPKPWFGVTVMEHYGRVIVQRVSRESPAMEAGIKEGDLILKVADRSVKNLEGFFRAVWNLGNAGVHVPLTLLQGNELRQLNIVSKDRSMVYQTISYD
mgnify:CR=1 FL=1